MSADTPLLIGRTPAPQRVHTLGQAVPTMGTGRRKPGDPPAPKLEPRSAEEMREAERERLAADRLSQLSLLADEPAA